MCFPSISPNYLNDLIQKSKEMNILIACYPTYQGESGYYINEKGKLEYYEITNNVSNY